jgi:heterodisulfide reductase subunit B
MKTRIIIRTSIIAIIGTSLVGCGASLEEYQKFATAGKEYASALDSLLVTSGNYFVDANSEILLRSDLQEPNEDTINYNQTGSPGIGRQTVSYYTIITWAVTKKSLSSKGSG